MKLSEFQAITADILKNREDQGKVSELLEKLNDDYTQVSTNIDNMSKQVSEYETQVDSLQKTNMNLFLKVSNPVDDEKLSNPEPLKYDDIIKEME